MKAVILAAGVGSRLAPLTDHQPKGMIAINGVPLLMHQINGLLGAGMKPEDIVVVTGHAAHVVQETIPPGVKCLHNPEFATKNNIYSFWLLHELNDDFLLINSDVFFPKSLFKNVIEKAPATCLVVDPEKELAEEEMKVELKRGLLRRISKKLRPDLADGEYIGLAKFSKDDARIFFDKADELLRAGQTNVWYENAIAAAADEVEIRAFKIPRVPWIEIDTHEDLAKARELLPEVEAFDDRVAHSDSSLSSVVDEAGTDVEIAKTTDAWYTVLFTDPIAIPLTYFIARKLPRITPNQVTAAAAILGIVVSVLFYFATPATLIIGALLYQFCFTLDCIDGKLARLTNRTSHYAAFYDLYLDQLRTMMCVMALAFGLVRTGQADWSLPLIGMGISFLYGFAIINLQKINNVREAFLATMPYSKKGKKKQKRPEPGRFWRISVGVKNAMARYRLRMVLVSSIEIQCLALVVAPLLYPWLERIWLGILVAGFLQLLLIPVLFHVRMAIAKVGKVRDRESVDDGA